MIFIISYEFSVEYHMYIIFVYLFTQTVLPLLNRFRDGNDQGYIVICSSGVIVMRCAIWYHLHNLKNVKNTHRGAVLLVSVIPPWVFFTLFIAQVVPNRAAYHIWSFFFWNKLKIGQILYGNSYKWMESKRKNIWLQFLCNLIVIGIIWILLSKST